MDAAKQQKILVYFIEETKEHLDTIEKGILDLQSVITDPESVNELFRAAHSVKGGAAMLGFGSIQTTAHRLEDCFKILKEHQIKVDQNLESLFLKAYDTLQDLVERLQGPFGLREEDAEKTVKEAEPVFTELLNYLNNQVGGGAATAEPPAAAPATPPAPQPAKTPPPDFSAKVMGALKGMLQLFKQPENQASRQKLEAQCNRLIELGAGIEPWQTVVKTAQQAIANPKNSYKVLAPLIIKELKQASDLLLAGKANAIAPSPSLKQLVPASDPPATPAPPPAKAASSQPKSEATAAASKQITLPTEPKAAAKVLIQTFNKQQLSDIAKLLIKAIKE